MTISKQKTIIQNIHDLEWWTISVSQYLNISRARPSKYQDPQPSFHVHKHKHTYMQTLNQPTIHI